MKRTDMVAVADAALFLPPLLSPHAQTVPGALPTSGPVAWLVLTVAIVLATIRLRDALNDRFGATAASERTTNLVGKRPSNGWLAGLVVATTGALYQLTAHLVGLPSLSLSALVIFVYACIVVAIVLVVHAARTDRAGTRARPVTGSPAAASTPHPRRSPAHAGPVTPSADAAAAAAAPAAAWCCDVCVSRPASIALQFPNDRQLYGVCQYCLPVLQPLPPQGAYSGAA